jgi:hypothetical protein
MTFLQKLTSLIESVELLALIRVALTRDEPLIVEALKQLKMVTKLICHEEVQTEMKNTNKSLLDLDEIVRKQEETITILREQLEHERNSNKKDTDRYVRPWQDETDPYRKKVPYKPWKPWDDIEPHDPKWPKYLDKFK